MHRLIWILAMLLATSASAAHADFPGWGWFGRGADATGMTSARAGASSKKTPLLTKVSSSTKRMVTNTKNLITPSKKSTKPPRQGIVATKQADKATPPQQSLLGRMFKPQQPTPPRTVGEWMSLEQPKP